MITRRLQRRAASSILATITVVVVILCCASSLTSADPAGSTNEPSCPSSHRLDEQGVCQSPDNNNNNNNNNKDDLSFLEFDKAAGWHSFLAAIFAQVEAHAATMQRPDLRAQERLILTTWLERVGMDPAVLTADLLEDNWLFTLYTNTHALAPARFFHIWDERARPTMDEIQLLLSIDDAALQQAQVVDPNNSGETTIDEHALMNHLFIEFRHRGFVMSLLDTFTRVLLSPLKTIAYAIPSPDNLQIIARYAPLMEVGAGTGYWSAVLQQQGVDITAYDAHPPKEGEQGLYFDRTFTQVHEGNCVSLFNTTTNKSPRGYNNRTLLMVWPNNPDNVDNAPEFHSSRLPPVWDADCVRAFVQAGGTTLILVAEREANIHVLPNHEQNPTLPDSGLCATRELQQWLERDFDLIHQMDVPTWYYSDDLTVWKIKKTAAPKIMTTTMEAEPN